MGVVGNISILICLLIVFIQDWKYRRMHLVLPIAIFLFSFFTISTGNIDSIKICLINTFFFLITLSILIVYMSIKNRRFLNPFENYFGLGDLLFYIAVSPFFELKNYILFFILSMIFAIVLQLGLKKIIRENTVPLAGFSALLLFLLIIKDMILDFQKITLI